MISQGKAGQRPLVRGCHDFNLLATEGASRDQSVNGHRLCLDVRETTQQGVVIQLHYLVALARRLLQPRNVHQLYVSSCVFDHPGFLQSVRDHRYAGASNAQHFGNVLLGQRQLVTAMQVRGS